MAILQGTDMRYFKIVPHPKVKGEKVLAQFVYTPIKRGYVMTGCWSFEDVYQALENYKRA